mgnify:CR=1 FL=1
MKSFQRFMKENEAQDDKMDTAIQDAENKKDAYLKKKREEEENKETEERLKYHKFLDNELASASKPVVCNHPDLSLIHI